ncbi:hypothetical protein CLV63_105122 [Murinocardiopsis flavida]|uniref:Uncharacterized protein n=1 Tax=Murinocardiopsis flavida TaxID=645275 RepID=A0A2P8DML2_9ACTN|nr:hypothetical protein [Murinocardiopsis flavida]PSK98448.1 hypothetical protein CLV63_105122 [Murinocardiopsis flavida]
MAEPMTGGRDRPPWTTKARWLPLGVTLGMIALLALGLPLLNALLPDSEPVPADRSMRIASGGGHDATLTFDPGWALHPDSSQEGQNYLFSRNHVRLVLNTVTPHDGSPDSAADLWSGMRKIVRVSDPATRLGEPRPVASDSGATGLSGSARTDTEAGTAGVFPAPGRDFAVEMVVMSGPEATAADVEAAKRAVRSIRFTEHHGGAP